jgi:hypothetical protein
MDSFVFAAVLLAAACHAGWNATIKGGLDPLATTVLISIGAAIVAAVFLPLVGLPARAAWPLCVASVCLVPYGGVRTVLPLIGPAPRARRLGTGHERLLAHQS